LGGLVQDPSLGLPFTKLSTLHYNDAASTQVEDQRILNVFGAHDLTLNQETGSVFIKFCVEDLSKNHQERDFKLLIHPKTTRFNIAPAFSPEFTV
jgi:hypothetical protein